MENIKYNIIMHLLVQKLKYLELRLIWLKILGKDSAPGLSTLYMNEYSLKMHHHSHRSILLTKLNLEVKENFVILDCLYYLLEFRLI